MEMEGRKRQKKSEEMNIVLEKKWRVQKLPSLLSVGAVVMKVLELLQTL